MFMLLDILNRETLELKEQLQHVYDKYKNLSVKKQAEMIRDSRPYRKIQYMYKSQRLFFFLLNKELEDQGYEQLSQEWKDTIKEMLDLQDQWFNILIYKANATREDLKPFEIPFR